jgi:hypothetical protein
MTKALIFEEQGGQQRDGNFAEHQQMQQRFLVAAGMSDVGCAVTEVIGKARGQPQRQDEVEKQRLGKLGLIHDG